VLHHHVHTYELTRGLNVRSFEATKICGPSQACARTHTRFEDLWADLCLVKSECAEMLPSSPDMLYSERKPGYTADRSMEAWVTGRRR
jgi:hypothetical protein